MVLSESKNLCVKLFIAVWSFLECILFSGVGYGWSSLVFVFKEEGIYSDLCEPTSSVNGSIKERDTNFSATVTASNERNPGGTYLETDTGKPTDSPVEHGHDIIDLVAYPTCVEQDSRFSLCFTITVLTYCSYCCIIGQVNYHYGTRIARLIS